GPDMVHGASLRRTQTSTLRAEGRPCMTTASERDSVPLERIAGYRTPLPSHLARRDSLYGLDEKKSTSSFSSPLTPASLHDKLIPVTWRSTQVWLKGSVLKTERRVTPRGGSNPSSSAISQTRA